MDLVNCASNYTRSDVSLKLTFTNFLILIAPPPQQAHAISILYTLGKRYSCVQYESLVTCKYLQYLYVSTKEILTFIEDKLIFRM